ncbi:MAG: hypothetical protein AB1758_07170 [Candidatus Eremiobacterota bacterium]
MRRGLSLVELVLALFLVVLVLGAVASVLPGLYRQSARSQHRFQAVAAAQGILAAYRSLPYGAPVPAELKQPWTFRQRMEDVASTTEVRVRSIAFEPANPSGDGPALEADFSRVTVTVEWEEDGADGVQTASASGVVVRR